MFIQVAVFLSDMKLLHHTGQRPLGGERVIFVSDYMIAEGMVDLYFSKMVTLDHMCS